MKFILLFVLAMAAGAQSAPTRSVHGTVSFSDGEPAAGAVVSIENTKTLDIRTYITKKDGSFVFHGLNTNIDYALTARLKKSTSAPATLSRFNSKEDAEIHLKLKD